MSALAKDQAKATLATIFGRLFENEFATLDGIAISCRSDGGMAYADGTLGLSLWLDDMVTEVDPEPADPAAHAIHEALYAAVPEHQAVISGWSRHLRALLLEGYAPPPATSMMRNRGVPDLGAHLVAPEALGGSSMSATIAQARASAERNGMRHDLIITTDGMVVVAGSPPFEAMAHWHNVEFAARVACMALEETVLRAAPSQPSAASPVR